MFRGPIRDAAINRTAGTRLPSLCVENGSGPLPAKNGPAIGVDVGVQKLAVETVSASGMLHNRFFG